MGITSFARNNSHGIHFQWWRHQLETIDRSPVDSPHDDQWRGALMFSVICAWTSGWANNRDSCDFRRHRAHYNVIVMHIICIGRSGDNFICNEQLPWYPFPMMTSSNGNIFRVTGPLWGKSTGHRWIPLTKASDAKVGCFLWPAPEQTAKQTIETPVIWDAIAPIIYVIVMHIICMGRTPARFVHRKMQQQCVFTVNVHLIFGVEIFRQIGIELPAADICNAYSALSLSRGIFSPKISPRGQWVHCGTIRPKQWYVESLRRKDEFTV